MSISFNAKAVIIPTIPISAKPKNQFSKVYLTRIPTPEMPIVKGIRTETNFQFTLNLKIRLAIKICTTAVSDWVITLENAEPRALRRGIRIKFRMIKYNL